LRNWCKKHASSEIGNFGTQRRGKEKCFTFIKEEGVANDRWRRNFVT